MYMCVINKQKLFFLYHHHHPQWWLPTTHNCCDRQPPPSTPIVQCCEPPLHMPTTATTWQCHITSQWTREDGRWQQVGMSTDMPHHHCPHSSRWVTHLPHSFSHTRGRGHIAWNQCQMDGWTTKATHDKQHTTMRSRGEQAHMPPPLTSITQVPHHCGWRGNKLLYILWCTVSTPSTSVQPQLPLHTAAATANIAMPCHMTPNFPNDKTEHHSSQTMVSTHKQNRMTTTSQGEASSPPPSNHLFNVETRCHIAISNVATKWWTATFGCCLSSLCL